MFSPVCKIILVGDKGIGKRSMINRFVNHSFSDYVAYSARPDFAARTLQVDDQIIKMQVWSPGTRGLIDSTLSGAHGCIIAYDSTDIESFYNVKKWLTEIHERFGNEVACVLVSTKLELVKETQVEHETAKKFVEENDMIFIPCSSNRFSKKYSRERY